jgi:hypothetical protein
MRDPMTSGVMSRATERPTVRRAPNRSRIVTALIVLLAVLGTVVATWSIVAARRSHVPGIGERIGTEFGSFTVTRVSKTFVPDTQGPPTPAQHVGANGSDQVQVWVSLRNTDDSGGVRLDPDQFTLVSETGQPRKQEAAGSSLENSSLQRGASIDGQVWFDPPKASGGQRWLEFDPPKGDVIRVSLGTVDTSTAPSPHQHPENNPDNNPDNNH